MYWYTHFCRNICQSALICWTTQYKSHVLLRAVLPKLWCRGPLQTTEESTKSSNKLYTMHVAMLFSLFFVCFIYLITFELPFYNIHFILLNSVRRWAWLLDFTLYEGVHRERKLRKSQLRGYLRTPEGYARVGVPHFKNWWSTPGSKLILRQY